MPAAGDLPGHKLDVCTCDHLGVPEGSRKRMRAPIPPHKSSMWRVILPR
jgi:hypothetical protein